MWADRQSDIRFLCPVKACRCAFKSKTTWTRHLRTLHPLLKFDAPDATVLALPRGPAFPTLNNRHRIQVSPPADGGASEYDLEMESLDPPLADAMEGYLGQNSSPPPYSSDSFDPQVDIEYHPHINGEVACNQDGSPISDPISHRASPSSISDCEQPSSNDWAPFESRLAFELAHFFFKEDQTSAAKTDRVLGLMAASLEIHNDEPPFGSYQDVHRAIDTIPIGGVPWQSHSFTYDGPKSEDAPKWMDAEYTVWYRDPHQLFLNMLKNPDFKESFDYAPYRKYDEKGNRWYEHFMSGDWAWQQADVLAEEPENHGAMFVPVILGSDKTTVSVGTGDNEFWPLYGSIGNIHNNIRRAHGAGLVLIAFLAIPKADNVNSSDPTFRTFRRQLFHTSLSKIFSSLHSVMQQAEIVQCPDGNYCHAIWGFGPYIGDYLEQILLACIVQGWCARCRAPPKNLDDVLLQQLRTQEITEALIMTQDVPTLWSEYGIISDVVPFTNDFPRADIHQLIAPDLLHQVIKGTFKDHLVAWVEKYLVLTHGKAKANRILDDIDHRIAIVPPFSGLRRFPEGRKFKQWTGDDSKALMKVYLPALQGHLPVDVIRTFRALLEFCYIARKSYLTEADLTELENALARFHESRQIFETAGVRPDGISLPRQHALAHYPALIRLFGAPNGLCSSISESKHIRAVKEPWRRSNRNQPLGQMLVTNQRLDQLAAARTDFIHRGMLPESSANDDLGADTLAAPVEADSPHPQVSIPDEDPLDEAVTDPNVLAEVTLPKKPRCKWVLSKAVEQLNLPSLPIMIRQFLYDQLYPDSEIQSSLLEVTAYPDFNGRISIYYCATATFRAPSDISGVNGMRRKYIRATPSWRNGPPRYDCVFLNTNPEMEGMRGLDIARVLAFFSLSFDDEDYQCALIHWFSRVGVEPDQDTGMWVVEPEFDADKDAHVGIVHIDSVYRAAHLIPVYRTNRYLSRSLTMHDTLDTFKQFYVNKFVDHHAFEIAF